MDGYLSEMVNPPEFRSSWQLYVLFFFQECVSL